MKPFVGCLLCIGIFFASTVIRDALNPKKTNVRSEKPSFLAHSDQFRSALKRVSSDASTESVEQLISSGTTISVPGKDLGHLTWFLPGLDDTIYIVDGANHRIVSYHKAQGAFQQFAKKGAGPGAYQWPSGMAFARNSTSAGGGGIIRICGLRISDSRELIG